LKDIEEYSLSCTCPTVVDRLNQLQGAIDFVYEGDDTILNDRPSVFYLRDAMIAIMQKRGFSINDRLILVFYMLLSLRNEKSVTKEILDGFKEEEYLFSLTQLWSGVDIDTETAFQEMNELFLDIVVNYRDEKSYRTYLKDIAGAADTQNARDAASNWKEFNESYLQNEKLLENCIVSKIFANCISDNMDDLIVAFQIIVTEYVLVRYSAFLQWLPYNKKQLTYDDVRDFIVIYSRIIEYNAEGISEFWRDSFDEAVWELGYMLLLLD
jgi:lysine-N-methylase